jgi:uncharacterized protein YqgC (DUF456 family)
LVSAEQIIGLTIALALMLAGALANLIPGIPGTPVVLVTAILHRLYFGAASVNNWVMGGLVSLTLFAIALDYLASMLGAKKLGATWRGIVGASTGALIGMFFGLPGIILGPFVGAVVFELLGGYKVKPAAKAGAGAVLGMIAGSIGKIGVCALMIVLFAGDVILRS